MPLYLAISDRDQDRYEWLRNDKQIIKDVESALNDMVNCGLIYNNAALRLYVCDEPEKITR